MAQLGIGFFQHGDGKTKPLHVELLADGALRFSDAGAAGVFFLGYKAPTNDDPDMSDNNRLFDFNPHTRQFTIHNADLLRQDNAEFLNSLSLENGAASIMDGGQISLADEQTPWEYYYNERITMDDQPATRVALTAPEGTTYHYSYTSEIEPQDAERPYQRRDELLNVSIDGQSQTPQAALANITVYREEPFATGPSEDRWQVTSNASPLATGRFESAATFSVEDRASVTRLNDFTYTASSAMEPLTLDSMPGFTALPIFNL